MNMQTLGLLRKLRDKFGPGPFGKIAQKLLALSFGEIGFTHIVERSIEGVDIDIAGKGDEKFSLEVKTTDGLSINLSANNIEALRKRTRDEYLPVIAALRLVSLEKWILAQIPLGELSSGPMPVYRLRAYRMIELENLLSPAFERVVGKHFQGTLRGGQQYLTEQLRRIGIEVSDF